EWPDVPAPWARRSRKAKGPVMAPTPNSMEEKVDVSAYHTTLRADARTHHTISTRRTDMGRAYRIGARAGEELAIDGLRVTRLVGRSCCICHLAVDPKPHRSLCCEDRQAGRGTGGRSRHCRLQTLRWRSRVVPSALHNRCSLAFERSGDCSQEHDPFKGIGERTVSIQVTSVVRMSDNSFQVKWIEQHFDHDALTSTEH